MIAALGRSLVHIQTGHEDGDPYQTRAHGNSRYDQSEVTSAVQQDKS
jgi:hypothetical protein